MTGLGFVYLKHDNFTLTLLGLAVVLVVARLAGRLFQRFDQPPVIGEVVAGLLLGPTLLGGASDVMFPLETRPLLKVLSKLGLVVFMFVVGLELEHSHLSRRLRRVAGGVGLAGTVIPFIFGMVLAVPLHRWHDGGVGLLPFALFLGTAMSITAVPVLARVLGERKLYDKPLGVVAMAGAAVGDVLAWATLALVVAIVASQSPFDLPYICALAVVFGVVMMVIVRPRLARFADQDAGPTGLSLVVVGILVSSFITSAIGVHEIFGAFMFGAIFPRGRFGEQVRERLHTFCLVLLPVFFVSTGLGVDVRDVGLGGLWQFGLIMAVACAGKLLGAIVGARPQGVRMREAVGLGVLMNTRGLTELIVLDIGRELGVLDDRLFTLLVLMAVATTVATGPLLRLVKPDPWLGQLRPAETPDPLLEEVSEEVARTGAAVNG